MSVPTQREIDKWFDTVAEYGLSDPPSMLAATLVFRRAREGQYPVRFSFGPDSRFCRTSRRGLRRALERLATAQWLILSPFTLDEGSAEISFPPEMVFAQWPGMYEARRMSERDAVTTERISPEFVTTAKI